MIYNLCHESISKYQVRIATWFTKVSHSTVIEPYNIIISTYAHRSFFGFTPQSLVLLDSRPRVADADECGNAVRSLYVRTCVFRERMRAAAERHFRMWKLP